MTSYITICICIRLSDKFCYPELSVSDYSANFTIRNNLYPVIRQIFLPSGIICIWLYGKFYSLCISNPKATPNYINGLRIRSLLNKAKSYINIFSKTKLCSLQICWLAKKNFKNHETQELFEAQKQKTTFMKAWN